MFTTLIVQPIFNLLVAIYALLPGHNFGLAIIVFTIVIRLLLWPLVKKQLHQTKLMRRIQPELKKIVAETKGNKTKRAMLQMELYKERGISPFSSIGVALVQLPILIGLFLGLQRVIKDPQEMINFAYPALRDMPWMKQLAENIDKFDSTLFGVVDLARPAIGSEGLYMPAMIIVLASVVTQYFQAKQLMPNDKDARSLREILRDAGAGKEADQSELGAAIGRSTKYILPAMIFVFTVTYASALGLYWFVSGFVAFIQQSIVLRDDAEEMEELSEGTSDGKKSAKKGTNRGKGDSNIKITVENRTDSKKLADIPEAEIVDSPARDTRQTSKSAAKKASRGKKRRRR